MPKDIIAPTLDLKENYNLMTGASAFTVGAGATIDLNPIFKTTNFPTFKFTDTFTNNSAGVKSYDSNAIGVSANAKLGGGWSA